MDEDLACRAKRAWLQTAMVATGAGRLSNLIYGEIQPSQINSLQIQPSLLAPRS